MPKELNGNHHVVGKVQPRQVHFSEWIRGSNQLKSVTRGELIGVMRVILERRLEVERNILRLEGWRHRLWRWLRRKEPMQPHYEAAIMFAYYGLFNPPAQDGQNAAAQPAEPQDEVKRPSGLVDLEGNRL